MGKSKSALDRRLEQLERESASLRNTINSLDYALKRTDRGSSPRLKLIPGRSASAPYPAAESKARNPVEKPVRRKIANYLSGGSFKAAKLTPQEMAVQRNKAIFMIVVLIIVLYVMLKLFHKV